jgi:uncharacterized protein involved in response to NO
MVPLLISGGVLTASVLLFRAALPKHRKRRWFIGTIWEPYVVVVLVTAAFVSLGFVAWSTIQLL